MDKITFYGATGTVTGSKYLLEAANKKILVDCGMFQGLKENRVMNWEPFPVPPHEIDNVFLTHAHIDHSGYLPRLVKYGFSGKVYCTYATKDLCEILLMDTAHLQEEDALWANKKKFTRHTPALPLYTTKDAQAAIKLLNPLYYGEDFFLTPDMRFKFRDAGHILGSSFVDVKITRGKDIRRILFTGDMGRAEQPILRNPVQVYNVDYLVLESTYGDRLHPEQNPKEELTRVINESIERGGVLVIPAFAVGRTQMLLYIIRELEEEGRIPKLPIYLDSPMAIDATGIFEKHMGDYDLYTRVQLLKGKKVLQPHDLRICRDREESKSINDVKSRAIIVSASGMLAGGRILHHLSHRLPDEKNTLLFIGYQAQGTRGRAILEGNETVKIHGRQIKVNSKIETIPEFSAHADYNEMLAWLMGLNRPPKMVFLVHGEPAASKALKKRIEDLLHWNVAIPAYKESYELE